MTSEEELPGQREIIITASDGLFTDTISLYIEVEVLNNNAPELSFEGRDTASFVEGTTSPVPIGTMIKPLLQLTIEPNVISTYLYSSSIGMVYQPLIRDADNNNVFFMESASVSLLGATDSDEEFIGISAVNVNGLQSLGISVTGRVLLYL